MKSAGKLIIATICAAAACQAVVAQEHSQKPAKVRTTIVQSLPAMNGKHLKVSAVEVVYEPSGASPVHSHPCPVVGYVVQGAVRMKVKGQPERIVHAGESFYEAANGIHEVSANASDLEPAKFVAYFVCDHETSLSTAAPTANDHEGGE
jgi:quercetin dioxygenase-like cupin family protein